MTGGKRKLGRKLLLLLVASIVALGLGEALARVFWEQLRPLHIPVTGYRIVNPAVFTGCRFGFAASVEFEGVYDGDPYGNLPEGDLIRYRTNRLGFREREFRTFEKHEAVTVLAVGDSFTFGEGVVAEDRFTEALETQLAERLGKPARVLNCGVSGYASVDEEGVVRAMVPAVSPDIVLLVYFLNDPLHISDPRYPASDLVMLRPSEEEIEAEGSGLRLLTLVRQRLATLGRAGKTIDWYRSLFAGDPSPWTESRGHLLSMRAHAKAGGADFVCAIFPVFYEVGGDYPFAREHARIRSWCEQHEIPTLDLQPSFAGRKNRDLVVHPKDHHPNARAHAIAARALTDFLAPRLTER
jgi:GDSL-like Lipase/Acylhydrolase family